MATLGSTNITTAISANAEQPVAFGQSGLIIEFFRATLGATNDTIAITPRWITDIRAAQSAGLTASNNLSSSAANTNITFTLTASGATTVNVDIQLIGRR